MTHPIIAELAQRLGKSEDEVVHFLQILWQIVPPSPETQPYFFRYLDERFMRLEDRISSLRQEMLLQIEGLRKEMQQGDANLAQQIESLRKEMQQGDANLAQQIDQKIESLQKEMNQQVESLRKEMQHMNDSLQQATKVLMGHIERLEKQIERLERWLFALTVPVLVSTIGIVGVLIQ
ncbi:MAG: hypothetical protein NZ805_07815, partial [Armatimonadetes bacterium]|nr:hypothetical protein [Armatimonadota bacterium]